MKRGAPALATRAIAAAAAIGLLTPAAGHAA